MAQSVQWACIQLPTGTVWTHSIQQNCGWLCCLELARYRCALRCSMRVWVGRWHWLHDWNFGLLAAETLWVDVRGGHSSFKERVLDRLRISCNWHTSLLRGLPLVSSNTPLWSHLLYQSIKHPVERSQGGKSHCSSSLKFSAWIRFPGFLKLSTSGLGAE
jgi:hypothetical protein